MSNILVDAHNLKGEIAIPYSKSMAHRFLVCAFTEGDEDVIRNFEANSVDVQATKDCLIALLENKDTLDCKESGTTLRFMLPLVAALGKECKLVANGTLVGRPMQVFIDELNRHGATISSEVTNNGEQEVFSVSGKLEAGDYDIPGNISSQFISGLMLATSIVEGDSWVIMEDEVESTPYIEMTQYVINNYAMEKASRILEGDWSSGAMWLVASQLCDGNIIVNGLNEDSLQPDRVILDVFELGKKYKVEVSAKDCPDLTPAIALWACTRKGETTITDTERLKLKESDRQSAIKEILEQLGADIRVNNDTILIKGTAGEKLCGSSKPVNTRGDHRMVMMAALASIVTEQAVLIDNPDSVSKSYPDFFEDLAKLGGKVQWN